MRLRQGVSGKKRVFGLREEGGREGGKREGGRGKGDLTEAVSGPGTGRCGAAATAARRWSVVVGVAGVALAAAEKGGGCGVLVGGLVVWLLELSGEGGG